MCWGNVRCRGAEVERPEVDGISVAKALTRALASLNVYIKEN